ncbi:hypothetical protein J3A83DRAFT_4101641, partial [Scleroderma citrinum]
HVHHQLVLDVVGESLTNFTSSWQLVQAIHNTLLTHQAAFNIGFLHWDLSPRNIIIVGNHGYLIDWDLAKLTNIETPCWVTHNCYFGQGTWQFMSAGLVKNISVKHTCQYDLESSFWVLLWTTLMYSESSFFIDEHSKVIQQTFKLERQHK